MADTIMAVLIAGGAGVARTEIARLLRSAVNRLSARGRVARELAIIAEAAARSDDEMADELARLDADARTAAVSQLRDSLEYSGPDSAQIEATRLLKAEADTLYRHLLIRSQAIRENTGQVIQNNANGVVHAPFRVEGDYRVNDSEIPEA